MSCIPTELLALSGEAAVVIRHGRVSFANAAAVRLLGCDCTGRPVREIFGPEVASAQASAFIGDIRISDRQFIVRRANLDSSDILFLSRRVFLPDLLSDALLLSLRSSLMSFTAAVNKARELGEDAGDTELLSQIAVLTRHGFSLRRLLTNLSVIRDHAADSQYFSPCVFDLQKMLLELADTLNPIFKDKPWIAVADSPAVPVTADAALMEQLLLNLLSNCYTHAEGCSRINVSLCRSGESVMISVDDNGCGIPPEELHSVFDRYRFGFSMEGMSKGAGLGLSVASGIAQLHGGTLLLESRRGIGTTVRVSIRAATGSLSNRDPSSAVPDMSSILTGLADCLPPECFTEKYTD